MKQKTMNPAHNRPNLQPKPQQIGANNGVHGMRQQAPFARAKMEYEGAAEKRIDWLKSMLPSTSDTALKYAAMALVVGGTSAFFLQSSSDETAVMVVLASLVTLVALRKSIVNEDAKIHANLMAQVDQKAKAFEKIASAGNDAEYNEFVGVMVGDGMFEKHAKDLTQYKDLSRAGDALLELKPSMLEWSLSESLNPEIALAAIVLATCAAGEEASDELKSFMKNNSADAKKTIERLTDIAKKSPSVAKALPMYVKDGAWNPIAQGVPYTILKPANP